MRNFKHWRTGQCRSLVAAGIAVIAIVGMSFVAGPATAATSKGGTIYIAVTPNNSATYPIVITGAFADYGTATTIDQNGTVNANGNYVRIALKQGGFEVDSTTLNKKANSSAPTFNSTVNCSYTFTVSGPVTLLNGSGAYKGISGTLMITESFSAILPRITSGKHKGQCNEANNVAPIASAGNISGSGKVSFS
jgi:uncharacterized protein (UPF0333 family)